MVSDQAIRSKTDSPATESAPRSIVSSGVGVFAVQLLGTGVGLLSHMFVSNMVGDVEYGSYTFLLSFMEILTLTSVLGMNITVLRFYSSYQTPERDGFRAGIRKFSRLFVLTFSIISLAIFLLGFTLFGQGEKTLPSFQHALLFGAFAVVVIAQNSITSSLLRAMRWPMAAMALPNVGRPLFLAVSFFVLTTWFVREADAAHAMLCYFLATILVGLIGWPLLIAAKRRMPDSRVKAEYEFKAWSSSAASLALAFGFRIALIQCSVIMVGFFLDYANVGYYSAAVRLSNLATFGLTATNFVVAPMIASAYARGELGELQKTLRTAAKLTLLMSLPIVVAIIGLGPFILERWGDDFSQAYPCLVILAAAQLFNAACGCINYLLAMSGKERQATTILGVAGLVNIVLNFVFVPRFGIYGAAAASFVTTVFWNVWMLIYVARTMKLNPTLIPFPKKLGINR